MEELWESRISLQHFLDEITVRYVENMIKLQMAGEGHDIMHMIFPSLVSYVEDANAGLWYYFKDAKKNGEVGLNTIMASSESLVMKLQKSWNEGKMDEYFADIATLLSPCIKNKNEVYESKNLLKKTRLFANLNSCVTFFP